MSRAEQKKSRRRENRLERYQRVIELYRAGRPKLAIAREIGLDVQTVRKFLRTDSFPDRAQRRRWSSVDPYLDHLRSRWSEGCRNATTLWREIRERGYRGAAINVRRCVKSWREADGRGRWKKDAPPGSKPPKSIAVPSPRRAKWILIRDLEKLDAEERLIREELLAASPIISRAANLVLDFGDMIRTRKSEHMEDWIATAKSSGIDAIKSFAAGIEADRAAVEAAMKFEWSNGQLEGQINRLKTIKRSMFGRANFDLLRKRVLAA